MSGYRIQSLKSGLMKLVKLKIEEYETLATEIEDIDVMIELAMEMEDESMIP